MRVAEDGASNGSRRSRPRLQTCHAAIDRPTNETVNGLPLVGRMFSHSRNEHEQTDVILMLTPHIVLVLDLTEDDLRPFLMDRDLGTASAGTIDVSQGQPLLASPPSGPPAQQNNQPGPPVQPVVPPSTQPHAPAGAPQASPPPAR